MKYLPYENVQYKSSESATLLIKRLEDHTEKTKTISYGKFSDNSSKLFEGEINNHTFKIKRIISYRNSFLPIIKGSINEHTNGSIIDLELRLQSVVIAFMIMWFAAVAFGSIIFIVIALMSHHIKAPFLIPFLMLLFAYIIIIASFNFEANKAKKELQLIFDLK